MSLKGGLMGWRNGGLDGAYHPWTPEAVIPKKKPASKQNQKRRRRLWMVDPHCHYCQKNLLLEETTLDHMTPRSRGGNNTMLNIVLSCQPCNNEKADMLYCEYLRYIKQPMGFVPVPQIKQKRTKVIRAVAATGEDAYEKFLELADDAIPPLRTVPPMSMASRMSIPSWIIVVKPIPSE